MQEPIKTALTGLSYDYIVGNSSSMFVPCRALIHPLIILHPLPADVHHQSPWVGPHANIGLLVNVKVGPISCPGEAEEKQAKVMKMQLIFTNSKLQHGNLNTVF